VFRIAVGAAILTAALFVMTAQSRSVPSLTGDLARRSAPAQASQDCTDADGAWHSQPDLTASMLESASRARTLQAACCATERGTVVPLATAAPLPPRAPAAPAHFQHIPLLI
jgi:hypothetical protein